MVPTARPFQTIDGAGPLASYHRPCRLYLARIHLVADVFPDTNPFWEVQTVVRNDPLLSQLLWIVSLAGHVNRLALDNIVGSTSSPAETSYTLKDI